MQIALSGALSGELRCKALGVPREGQARLAQPLGALCELSLDRQSQGTYATSTVWAWPPLSFAYLGAGRP